MAYSDERLLILKMLQEGKITSDEAARLLDALNDGKSSKQNASKEEYSKSDQYAGDGQQGAQYKKSNLQDELNKIKENMNRWGQDIKSKYNQKDFDQSVEDFAQKAEKVGKDVANTTIGVLDKVMDYVGSFIDTNTFRHFGDYNVEKRTYEAVAAEGMDLIIEGRNGQISVKKHEDSNIKIITKIKYREENPDQILIFDEKPGSVTLKVNITSNVSISHEVFIPEVRFNNIKIITTNAHIYIENAVAEVFEGETKNSSVDVSGITATRVNLSTKNARIQANNIIAKEMNTSTANAVIDLKNLSVVKVNASTKNARINIESVQNYGDEHHSEMHLRTTNSNIKVNMNDIDNMGYRVKALTTNGGINLLLPDVIYSNVNRPGAGGRFAEAKSRGFEDYISKISIDAETTNGFIEIVK